MWKSFEPTFAPEICIKHDLIDMVCVGEGENALIDLCKKIESKNALKELERWEAIAKKCMNYCASSDIRKKYPSAVSYPNGCILRVWYSICHLYYAHSYPDKLTYPWGYKESYKDLFQWVAPSPFKGERKSNIAWNYKITNELNCFVPFLTMIVGINVGMDF